MWVEFVTFDENGDVLKNNSLMVKALSDALSMIQKWADVFNCTYHYYVHEGTKWEASKSPAYANGDNRSHLFLEHNAGVISKGIIRPRG